MRMTQLLTKTLRSDPAETEIVSHRLMVKAGFIYQVASGIYAYLPLAWRSLRKIENIIREEMDAVGGQELRLSVLQPRELWQQSGRDEAYGPDMFRLEDRRNRPLVMAPTHEELLTRIIKDNVKSYRDLPLLLYQLQTKFRDEPRSRGGLIRVREFDMKDAYSLHVDEESLDLSYEKMMQTYKRIYARCGLSVTMIEADSGAIGGKDSHEFVLLADSGEDTIIMCEECGYAANSERATFKKLAQPYESPAPLEEVHTPDIKTIMGLGDFLNVPTNKTLKAVFYMADREFVFVTIRGDLEVNEVKLKNTLKASELRLASPEEVKEAGIVAGSASPVGLKDVKVVADDSINLGCNFVVGANKINYHLKNANHPRDFKAEIIGDFATAQAGDFCSNCETKLVVRRGIEVGHIFKLGTRYSEMMGAYFLDQDGEQRHFIMGCYGIGVGRLLSAVIEQNNDAKGMMLPLAIAPYQTHLVGLNLRDPAVTQLGENLYRQLWDEGIETLYDERIDESPGVKFNDADLWGLPIRIVISPRNLKQNVVEIKLRTEKASELVDLTCVVDKVKEKLT